MNGTPMWPLYLTLAFSGTIIFGAVLIMLRDGVRFAARHLRWWWQRRQERKRRPGDLIEALARRIEGPWL